MFGKAGRKRYKFVFCRLDYQTDFSKVQRSFAGTVDTVRAKSYTNRKEMGGKAVEALVLHRQYDILGRK